MSKTCTCSPRDGACADHAAYFAERARGRGSAYNAAYLPATACAHAAVEAVKEAAKAEVCLCGAPTPNSTPCGGCAV